MQTFKFFTPNPSFTGRRYGVAFVNGVGEANQKQAEVLKRNYNYSSPEYDAFLAAQQAGETGGTGEGETGPGQVLTATVEETQETLQDGEQVGELEETPETEPLPVAEPASDSKAGKKSGRSSSKK